MKVKRSSKNSFLLGSLSSSYNWKRKQKVIKATVQQLVNWPLHVVRHCWLKLFNSVNLVNCHWKYWNHLVCFNQIHRVVNRAGLFVCLSLQCYVVYKHRLEHTVQACQRPANHWLLSLWCAEEQQNEKQHEATSISLLQKVNIFTISFSLTWQKYKWCYIISATVSSCCLMTVPTGVITVPKCLP